MPADLSATIVIVNYNGGKVLPACLDALARGDDRTLPVWIVDNASTDGSAELVERNFPHVRVIRSPDNLGFAGGNNLALRQLATDAAVLLNPDTVPDSGSISRLVATLGQRVVDGAAAVCAKVVFLPKFAHLAVKTDAFVPGPHDTRELGVRLLDVTVNDQSVLTRIVGQDLCFGLEGPADAPWIWTRDHGSALIPIDSGESVTSIRVLWVADRPKNVDVNGAHLMVNVEPSWVDVPLTDDLVDVINNVGGVVNAEGYGADRGYQEIDNGQYDSSVEVFTGGGTAVALLTDAGRQVGWFDDDFFLYYEDTDLGWRLRMAGYRAFYEPAARVRHHHSALTGEFSPLWWFHVDRNRLLMLIKDAELPLALSAALRYQLTTASMVARALRSAARRQRPDVGRLRIRARVTVSFLRLLPTMVIRRRQIGRDATMTRHDIQREWVGR